MDWIGTPRHDGDGIPEHRRNRKTRDRNQEKHPNGRWTDLDESSPANKGSGAPRIGLGEGGSRVWHPVQYVRQARFGRSVDRDGGGTRRWSPVRDASGYRPTRSEERRVG